MLDAGFSCWVVHSSPKFASLRLDLTKSKQTLTLTPLTCDFMTTWANWPAHPSKQVFRHGSPLKLWCLEECIYLLSFWSSTHPMVRRRWWLKLDKSITLVRCSKYDYMCKLLTYHHKMGNLNSTYLSWLVTQPVTFLSWIVICWTVTWSHLCWF